MAKSIVQDVFIDVKTRGDQTAKRQMADLGKTIKGVNTEVKDVSASVGKFNDDLQKKGPSAWQSFGSGIKSVAQAMTPLNQGLALAGKLINAADEALDAYAKTSPHAAREVAALTNEFEGYKRAVMEATGETVAFVLKGTVSFDNMRSAAARMAQTGEDAASALGKVSNYGLTDVAKSFLVPLKDTENWWITSGKDTFGAIADGFDEAAQKAKKARTEAERWRLELAAYNEKLANLGAQEQRERRDPRALFGGGESAIQSSNLDFSGLNQADDLGSQIDKIEEVRTREERYAKFRSNQKKSVLEEAFGSVDEMSLYRQEIELTLGVVDSFGQAVGSAYEAIVTGQGSVSAAFKKVFADQLLALGKSSVVEAIKETALGFGALASYQYPAATLHFKSAALHGAVAVAAGAGAAALGAGGSGGGGGNAAAASPAAGTPGRDQRTGFGGGQGDRPVLIVYADPFADQDQRQRALTAEKTWRRVQGSTGSQDS